MKAFSMTFLLASLVSTIAIASSVSVQHVQCQVDQTSTEALVKSRQPVSKTAKQVVQSETDALNLTIQDGKIANSSSLTWGDGKHLMGDDVATQGDLVADSVVERAGQLVVKMSADGYDHMRWTFTIDETTGRASVKENFLYDCGDDTDAVALYNCSLEY